MVSCPSCACTQRSSSMVSFRESLSVLNLWRDITKRTISFKYLSLFITGSLPDSEKTSEDGMLHFNILLRDHKRKRAHFSSSFNNTKYSLCAKQQHYLQLNRLKSWSNFWLLHNHFIKHMKSNIHNSQQIFWRFKIPEAKTTESSILIKEKTEKP